MADSACLESTCTGDGTMGSNPILSASLCHHDALPWSFIFQPLWIIKTAKGISGKIQEPVTNKKKLTVCNQRGNYSGGFNFGSGQGARNAEPERIWEYVRAHGAKSAKFVRAEGCEHHSNAVIGQKGSHLSSYPLGHGVHDALPWSFIFQPLWIIKTAKGISGKIQEPVTNKKKLTVCNQRGNYSGGFNFGSGQGARNAEPERIWEYVRAHGAKSAKFVRAEGCEHHSNAVIGQKGSDLSSYPTSSLWPKKGHDKMPFPESY